MKKTIAILLCVLLLVAAAACTKTQNPAPVSEGKSSGETGAVAGGWTVAENVAVTNEQKAIFDKAMDELVGVDYMPIALLGTQVVAGTNYCFLAKATVVYPDALPTCKLVYIYADLEGGAKILNIADMPIVPNEDGSVSVPETETLSGGWAYAESYDVTDEMKDRLEKALSETVGASYEPILNLGTQVVAGLNRCLLCKVSPVVPNPVPHYALVYVYENLEGGAALLNVIDFDFGALCTYGA